MPVLVLVALALASSCGSDSSRRAARPATEMEASPSYDLHEWGLVTTSSRGFELAAGPGQRVALEETLIVDKPILYVHADAAFDLSVEVTPHSGLTFAERWPAMNENTWQVSVSPESCRGQTTYPQSCNAPDGYCEVAELALYETEDAACLRSGDKALPLLFYRMRHASLGPSMPLSFTKDGDDVVVENESWEGGVGEVWRISWDGNTGTTHATHAAVPARGERVSLARATSGGVAEARAAIRTDLAAHGLTVPETDAFMRAWDEALFGASTSTNDRRGVADEDGDDGLSADSPVEVNDETSIDSLTDSENIPAIQGGPRIADVVVYWLPRSDIDGLAEISAQPEPRSLRRAILVRADVR